MTAPQDPFGTPPEGNPPHGTPPAGDAGQPGGQGYGSAPGGYGQPAYGQPHGGGYGGSGPKKNGFGVAALVLGILALLGVITIFFGIIFGILAIIFGILGRGRVKKGEADNGGMALTGLILGAVGLLLSIAIIAAGVSFLNSGSGQELQDCLDQAVTQEEIDACGAEFEDSFFGN